MSEQYLPGGTVRVSFGTESTDAATSNGHNAADGQGQGVVEGTTRINHDGSVSTLGVTQYINIAAETPASEGVIASCRNPMGNPCSINDRGATVMVEGTRTSVAAAKHLGYILADGNG